MTGEDSGRKGYREPDEPADGRPVISRDPFWRDETERLTYEEAVEAHPRQEGEGALTYLARIVAVVEGKYAAAGRTMPHAMSRRQVDERLAKLRRQAEEQREREERAQAVAP